MTQEGVGFGLGHTPQLTQITTSTPQGEQAEKVLLAIIHLLRSFLSAGLGDVDRSALLTPLICCMWQRLRFRHLFLLLVSSLLISLGYWLWRYPVIYKVDDETLVEEVEDANTLKDLVDTLQLRHQLTPLEYRQARVLRAFRNDQGNLVTYYPDMYLEWNKPLKAAHYTARSFLYSKAASTREYVIQLRTYTQNDRLIDTLTFAYRSDSRFGSCDGTLFVDRLKDDTLISRTVSKHWPGKNPLAASEDSEYTETFRLMTNGQFARVR